MSITSSIRSKPFYLNTYNPNILFYHKKSMCGVWKNFQNAIQHTIDRICNVSSYQN